MRKTEYEKHEKDVEALKMLICRNIESVRANNNITLPSPCCLGSENHAKNLLYYLLCEIRDRKIDPARMLKNW